MTEIRKKILIAVVKENTSRGDVKGSLLCRNSIIKVLAKKGIPAETLWIKLADFKNLKKLKEKILKSNPRAVFNLFEGFGNDSQKEIIFANLLEKTGIPHTGNSAGTLNLCLNKAAAKEILNKNNIPVPKGIFVKNIKDLKQNPVSFPVFIKPCFEDASVGIDSDSLVVNEENIYKIINKKLKKFPEGLIVEEFMPGREYNAGFLGNFPYELVGVSTINYAEHNKFSPFLTYSSKWEEKTQEYKKIIPSLKEKISEKLKKEIIKTASRAGKLFGCKGYFRVDFRQRNGKLFLLDVNPNPDINTDSGFMKQAYHKGYTYEETIEKIIRFAVEG